MQWIRLKIVTVTDIKVNQEEVELGWEESNQQTICQVENYSLNLPRTHQLGFPQNPQIYFFLVLESRMRYITGVILVAVTTRFHSSECTAHYIH